VGVESVHRPGHKLVFVGGSVIRHDPEDDKLGNVSRSEPFEFRPGMFITPGALITANLAFRKAVLESLGGFDEVFAYGNGLVGDDVDAVARASADGWRGLFDPGLVVRHHHGRRTPEEVAAVQRGYDAGRGAFFAKCLLDPRLRRVYTAGWAKMTAEQLARGEVRKTARELGGAARYLTIRPRDQKRSPTARMNRPP
jgi:GT2 family glycosyltransferase